MIIPRRKKKNSLKEGLILGLSIFMIVLVGGAGSLHLKKLTGDQPIELALIGYKSPSEEYKAEAEQYRQEIERLKQENIALMSRGESREVEVREATMQIPTPIPDAPKQQFNNLQKAISNNIKGVFNSKAPFIIDVCKKWNVNPMLATAIMYHETGNGSSKAVVNLNNPGGLMSPSTGRLMVFNTLEGGIEATVKCLKTNYIDLGLVTIEKIQKKYCPVGATNDPTGLNVHWLSGVTKTYLKILEEAK